MHGETVKNETYGETVKNETYWIVYNLFCNCNTFSLLDIIIWNRVILFETRCITVSTFDFRIMEWISINSETRVVHKKFLEQNSFWFVSI